MGNSVKNESRVVNFNREVSLRHPASFGNRGDKMKCRHERYGIVIKNIVNYQSRAVTIER